MSRLTRWTAILFIVLLVNTAYIAAYASPTIFYMTNVLLHVGLGTALFFALIAILRANPSLRRDLATATGFFFIALLLGGFLAGRGNITENRWAFWSHVGAAALGVAALAPFVWGRARPPFKHAFFTAAALLIAWPASTAAVAAPRAF